MKLGVLLDRFDPARGGAEAHTDALLRRAVERGFAPALACLEGMPPAGVRAIAVTAARGSRAVRDRALALDGERALRDAGCDRVFAIRHALRCDVYLPHGGLVADAFAARDACRGGVGPLTRFLRRFSGRRAFFDEAERALLGSREGPVVVALSQSLRGRIAVRYPAARGRICVVQNGVDVERFDPALFAAGRDATRRALGVPADAYVGLLLAHEPWLKGFGTLLDVLARQDVRALSPAFHVIVAGRRAHGDLLRAASRRGAADRVHLAGVVPDARPLYAAADVLCQPTWHDPCSLTSLEALSMAVPVITTTRNGVTELMAMRGGIPVEQPSDVLGFAKAIEILAEPRIRKETSDDARYVAKRNRLVTRLDQLLDVCVNLGPPKPPARLPSDQPPADPCLENDA